MKKLFHLAVIALVISAALTGCGQNPPLAPEKKTVVATFFPYYVFTKNLAGDVLNVELLIDNQSEPHDYQFKPSDLTLLKNANLIIKNGLGMDDWIDEAINSAGSKASILNASTGLNLLAPQREQEFMPEEEHEDDHEHGLYDPHVWVSPKNAIQILPNITKQLINLAPSHKAELERLLTEYTQNLQALDNEIAPQLSSLPNKQFVSFHPAIQYFARDYGLRNIASLQSYPGEEPTPYYLKQLTDYIHRNNIKVITTEPQFSPQLVQTLANDLGLTVISFDPLETGDYNPNAYQDIVRQNVANLLSALGTTS